jgi:antitoxin YefM
MEAVAYSNFRQNLRSIMKKVNDDAERLVVTTNDNSNIVVMSQDDYNAWMETFYLMQSPTNRRRIDDSIEQLENGLGKEHELSELSIR